MPPRTTQSIECSTQARRSCHVDNFVLSWHMSKERAHFVTSFNPAKNAMRANFTLPYIREGKFAYIQAWIVDDTGRRTAEVGLAKHAYFDHWIPLVFNTDDGHSSGYFGDKLVQWPMSVQRTRQVSDMILSHGDSVVFTVNAQDNEMWLWINHVPCGGVKINFTVSRFEFGFEQDQYGEQTDFNVTSLCEYDVVNGIAQW